jgi:hypothetical protein
MVMEILMERLMKKSSPMVVMKMAATVEAAATKEEATPWTFFFLEDVASVDEILPLPGGFQGE